MKSQKQNNAITQLISQFACLIANYLLDDQLESRVRILLTTSLNNHPTDRSGISVAESVKALQNRGHTPCSPRTLRRAHSVASPYATTQQQQPQPLQQPQQQKPREQGCDSTHLKRLNRMSKIVIKVQFVIEICLNY